MRAWRGLYNGQSPCVSFLVAGTKGHPEEIVATVDTGFSGFLLMSQAAAEPHGLETVGTTNATLADGQRQTLKTALASVGFANCTRRGLATLSAAPCQNLVGLDFLRKFELALVLTNTKLILVPIAALDAVPGWLDS